MPKYIVREGEHIIHDNKEFNGGDTITLAEEQAKALRVDPVEEKQKEKGKSKE